MNRPPQRGSGRRPEPYGRVTTARPRRIQIQQNQPTQSATTGQMAGNWVTVASATTIAWTTAGGSFTHIGDEPRADEAARIRIRYRTDITIAPLTTRIAYNGRNFGIVSCIDVNEQHQYFDIALRAMA